VRQNEGGFVLNTEVAGERRHALALYLIAEDRDGGEVGAQRHLVKGEEDAGRDAEIGFAILAAPPWRAIRAAAS